MDYNTLVSQFPGYASWNDQTSALNDYAATGGAGKGGSAPTSSSSTGSTTGRYVGGVDESQLPSTLDYINKLNSTEDTALNDIMMAMKARKSPLDVYQGLEEAAGLPGLRTTATSLSKEIGNIEDTLGGIEPNIAARTKESLVTEAQRSGMVNAERKPYLDTLGKLTTGLGRISNQISSTGQEIGTKVGLFQQGQEMNLEPLKMKYTALVDRNARNLSGFTADKQTKLEILMDQMNRQRTLSDQDWQLANSLSAEKRDYVKQLQTAAANAGYKVTGSESEDQLLGIIGSKAAEQIAYSRSQANKVSAATAKQQQLEQDVLNKAAGGATLKDLQKDYGAELGIDRVAQLYASTTGYGNPTEPYAQNILGTVPKDGSVSGGFSVGPDGTLQFN